MTVLRSPVLTRAGFGHGFGTRRALPEELPGGIHILLQVHGERIVFLSENTMRVQSAWNKAQSENLQLSTQSPPASPFRFAEGDALVTDIPGVSIGIRTADCLPLL
ncbi:MAG: laccase domain-containing protein, partial [bacterium]